MSEYTELPISEAAPWERNPDTEPLLADAAETGAESAETSEHSPSYDGGGSDQHADADQLDERDEATPEREPEAGRAALAGQRASTPSRASVRRIAARALALAAASQHQRQILTAILGGNEDPVDLTVAITTAGRDGWRTADFLMRLGEANQLEAAVLLMKAERSEIRAVWGLASVLGLDIPAKTPANDMEVVQVLVSAIQSGAWKADLVSVCDLATGKASA